MSAASHNIDLVHQMKDIVIAVGDPVTSEDIDTYRQLREIEDRSYKLRTMVSAWERQQTEERTLRKSYAGWLLFLLFAQVFIANAAFFLIGFKYLIVEEWVAKTFIISVFGEITAVTLVVVRYLFGKQAKDFPNFIDRL